VTLELVFYLDLPTLSVRCESHSQDPSKGRSTIIIQRPTDLLIWSGLWTIIHFKDFPLLGAKSRHPQRREAVSSQRNRRT